MSKEERNKQAIGTFGQTEVYKEVVKTIAQLREAKRKVKVIERQDRIDAFRTNAELECIYDDVRAIHPGLTREQFYYTYCHCMLNLLEKRLKDENQPPKHGDDFTRGEF